jgi:hypothetical protein
MARFANSSLAEAATRTEPPGASAPLAARSAVAEFTANLAEIR